MVYDYLFFSLMMSNYSRSSISSSSSLNVLLWCLLILNIHQLFQKWTELFYYFLVHVFLCSWWGVGSLSCSLFYQYSLWSFSLNHYSNIVHSHHFLFQHFSISVCWRTTKCVMGKLPCCRER